MKVEIVDWQAVASWHWDLKDDSITDELCGICRVAFDGTCPNCKYPGNECPLILGAGCQHNFHLHCILQWLEQDTSKGLCPMCRQVFEFRKDFNTVTKDINSLLMLIDGHKSMRDREVDEEFDSFDDDLRMND
ncbi:anaphase-promoting complex subunit 11 [[Candida] jaroonii]|uniref:Anaphase-promoting complex subunit 11 n=1 Tax=[Candida] jaroonii TaxID=467808 RepID=A0ACA9Y8P8_9ASCO|nr:anaphase-promoting complex subunit 11 [[Candida] jaroonii]